MEYLSPPIYVEVSCPECGSKHALPAQEGYTSTCNCGSELQLIRKGSKGSENPPFAHAFATGFGAGMGITIGVVIAKWLMEVLEKIYKAE